MEKHPLKKPDLFRYLNALWTIVGFSTDKGVSHDIIVTAADLTPERGRYAYHCLRSAGLIKPGSVEGSVCITVEGILQFLAARPEQQKPGSVTNIVQVNSGDKLHTKVAFPGMVTVVRSAEPDRVPISSESERSKRSWLAKLKALLVNGLLEDFVRRILSRLKGS